MVQYIQESDLRREGDLRSGLIGGIARYAIDSRIEGANRHDRVRTEVNSKAAAQLEDPDGTIASARSLMIRNLECEFNA